MNTIERVMRVMTHINIGATLGTGAWVLWSGLMIVGAPLHGAADRPAAAVTRGQGTGTGAGIDAGHCAPCSAPQAHPAHPHEWQRPISEHAPAVTPRSDT